MRYVVSWKISAGNRVAAEVPKKHHFGSRAASIASTFATCLLGGEADHVAKREGFPRLARSGGFAASGFRPLLGYRKRAVSEKSKRCGAREGNNLTPSNQVIDDATSFSCLCALRFEPQMNSGDFREATGEQPFGDCVADDLGTKPPTPA